MTPGDGDALAAPVARLAADPHLRAVMGLAARSKVQGRSWAALTGELIEHYVAVIAAHAPRELVA
ncbi:MAG: glycosyl transferase family 1 [Actinomycetia bacterium]|nr:glycosyl transferase family 1 [Actinomycetes bacterium]